MNKFKLIVLLGPDGQIGRGIFNLPWTTDPSFKEEVKMKRKEDFSEFKKLTIGEGKNIVVMGKNTYDSIPNFSKKEINFLDDRLNIVLSSHADDLREIPYVIYFYSSFPETINDVSLKFRGHKDCWILGGLKIYQSFIDLKIPFELHFHYFPKSQSHLFDKDCDVFFPKKFGNFDFDSFVEENSNLDDDAWFTKEILY